MGCPTTRLAPVVSPRRISDSAGGTETSWGLCDVVVTLQGQGWRYGDEAGKRDGIWNGGHGMGDMEGVGPVGWDMGWGIWEMWDGAHEMGSGRMWRMEDMGDGTRNGGHGMGTWMGNMGDMGE